MHVMKKSNGHVIKKSNGHIRLGGGWHNRYYAGYDNFAGYIEIFHNGDWGESDCGYNEDPNDFFSTAKSQAEANFSTSIYDWQSTICGHVGYHGYQLYPLGWPGYMTVRATCIGRWQKFSTGSITATSVKITTTGSSNARFGVFSSEPSASQIKSASRTSSGVFLFNTAELAIYNANTYVWISYYLPVPTGFTLPVADLTNATRWVEGDPTPQYYLGTGFWELREWKNSGTPDDKDETVDMSLYLNVYY